jgi:transposase
MARPGVFRRRAPNPDRIVESVAPRCPHCNHALTPADQSGVHADDHIALPPLRPVITRIHRRRGTCPGCHRNFRCRRHRLWRRTRPLARTSPPHPGIGFERLVRLLDEVFDIRISEGAIVNMLAHAQTPLAATAETIAAEIRRSKVVASDETSARVDGKNWWQWVLLSSTAVHHLIADSRGAAVLTDFLGDAKPVVWVADRYAAQAGHGDKRQLCLAHLLRDTQYAIDSGDTGFAPGFYQLLQRAVAIGHRRPDLKDTTLVQYRADLDRRLDRLLAISPTTQEGQKLVRGIRKCRGDLFVFLTHRDVPATNNECERALRPSVIFRKVTGGFRSPWGARTYANALSVIATGRLHGRSALQALGDALAGRPILVPP